jgi:hypothetical protein
MKDEKNQALEILAEKLGTTAEYLWKVLVKQAPISATIDIVYFILITIGGYLLFRLHIYLSKERGDKEESLYYKYEEVAGIPMVIVCVLWGVAFIISFCFLGDVAIGFANPEYWALNEILNSLK